jgi:HrpA-like RNA helicase
MKFRFRNTSTGLQETHDLQSYRDFIEHHVRQGGLPIGKYLSQINDAPFFIVAATGVGKTVGIPLHLFIGLSERLERDKQDIYPLPVIYIIEPTIPICLSEMEHMNESFHAFMEKKVGAKHSRQFNPFGTITGARKANMEAPVLFVTTGIFELVAKDPQMIPNRTRFVIDEAHRVLKQSDGVEIALAVARKRGCVVDFMSATVDTTTLDKQLGVKVIEATEKRFPILKIAAQTPLENCIEDLAARCLLNPNANVIPQLKEFSNLRDRNDCERVSLHLLSEEDFIDPVDGQKYPGLNNRAQGMLVFVNSHQGENSDTRRIAEQLRRAFSKSGHKVEILRYASPVERDPEQKESFRRRVEGIESKRGRYVIITTSVAEMGVTFPSLDYVVTMDTELETAAAYGAEITRETPLGVNAMFQRIGRVGRKRPGLAIITREDTDNGANAHFSNWSAEKLATGLKLEPIGFAISDGKVKELGFFLYEKFVSNQIPQMQNFLAQYAFPSTPEKSESLLKSLKRERDHIQSVGLSNDGVRLNPLGTTFREIGVVQDLQLGKLLAHCCLNERRTALPDVAAVAAAMESIGFRGLLGRRTFLDADIPNLTSNVHFPHTDFAKPLTEVWQALVKRSSKSPIAPAELGTSEDVAHHISELIADGYVLSEPQKPKDSRTDDKPILLTFKKTLVELDRQSELLASYEIVRYFFNKYRWELQHRQYAEFEKARVRRSMMDESSALGLNPSALLSVLGRLSEIARKADIDLRVKQSAPTISSNDASLILEAQQRIDSANGISARRSSRPDIDRAAKEIQASSPRESLLPLEESDRKELLRLFGTLQMFATCNLTRRTDERGKTSYVGQVVHDGNQVEVDILIEKTPLRCQRETFVVRGQVVPMPYRDKDGKEQVRYVLNHTTIQGGR